MSKSVGLPSAFIWRRLHSLTGLFLAGYLIVHLLTNSQAALYFGDDGRGFIEGVNSIHELPYLIVIELALLAVPILIHMIWGILYLRQAQYNSYATDGSSPSLPEYGRNKAYTWQRITSFLLIFGIIGHIVHMRVIEYPEKVPGYQDSTYLVAVTDDDGLWTLADRLSVNLYTREDLEGLKTQPIKDDAKTLDDQIKLDKADFENERTEQLKSYANKLRSGQVLAEAPDFGTADLLVLRNTFKNPILIAIYTIFVLVASYHAFNGCWTFLISWGITLSEQAQRRFLKLSYFFMVAVSFLGLVAIFGTYYNLRM